MIKISPSIISANFAILQKEIEALTAAGADYIHFDVMDGNFVPNITFGPALIKALRKHTSIPFDVHLMINSPERCINEFVDAGADIITIHYEAVTHIDRVINQIKSHGKKAGISIVPSTSHKLLEYILPEVDLVLVMTVNPGFGGQKFLENQLSKITHIKHMISNLDRQVEISVDGGVNGQNHRKIIAAGADVLVAGSYIFADDYHKQINSLRS